MRNIWLWIKNNPNRSMFLVPILLVAGISISHVVTWYDMANPINWAIYLSIAIEVGAITALVAATNRIKGGIWFMFGLVTFIQMVGNIFYSYKEIDATGDLFKSWVELTGPIWELLGTEQTDLVGLKRWLAFLEGGLLPIISLTSLHFFVKYEDNNPPKEGEISPNSDEDKEKDETVLGVDSPKEKEISPKIDTKEIWDRVEQLRNEGKLPIPTEEEIEDEPTDLAFTPYESDIEEEFDEEHALDIVLNDMVKDLSDEDIDELFDVQPDNRPKNDLENTKKNDSEEQLIKNAIKKYKESRTKTNISRIN
jgi:hypothetical protein